MDVGYKKVNGLWLGSQKIVSLDKGDKRIYSSSKIVGYVHIGEHDYPYVKIGNLLWTSKDLDEDIGTNYKFDLSGIGRYYRINSLVSSNENETNEFKNILADGWRIPKKTDFEYLILNNIAQDIQKKGNPYWEEATDKTEFSATPNGYEQNGSVINQGLSYCRYYTKTIEDNYFYKFKMNGNELSVNIEDPIYGMCIRLCKDA